MFASTIDDSLEDAGGNGAGRKRFQWTVLPRQEGVLDLASPEFAWFDPWTETYRIGRPPPIRLSVGPPLYVNTGATTGFPAAFAAHPVDPGARDVDPWVFALGGLALGFAGTLWRVGGRRPPNAAVTARQKEWLRAVGLGSGPDFWRAADEASAWLHARAPAGTDRDAEALTALRSRVAVARYGGTGVDPEPIRRELVERLSRTLPRRAAGAWKRAAAVALALAAVGWCVILGPRPGEDRLVARARAGDAAARAGQIDVARTIWTTLWREGGRKPGVAARLAWVEAQSGALGPAAAWILRGNLAGARDPALAWATERVREGGGLVGGGLPRLPITPLEWSVAALLLGFAAAWAWPRRRVVALCAALALVAATVYPLQGWLGSRADRAVVLRSTPLEGTDIELQAGQVVSLRGRQRGRVQVRAGRVAQGWVPADAVLPVTR